MSTPRDTRRLALLALYQLDVLKGEDTPTIRATLDDLDSLAEEGMTFADAHRDFSAADRDRAMRMAEDAWDGRALSDAAFAELAPEWPAHRMPAIDRAILRLSYHEMHAGSPPKVVVNEAVELAKQFSTADSPRFINAVLDKVLKRVLNADAATPATPSTPNPPADGEPDGATEPA